VGARLATRSGYSIGIAFPPSWDEGYIVSLNQGDSAILEEGMTFHIIPWMWGVDGDKTCGISDTIYITDQGCKSFFSMERDFVVKPEPSSNLVDLGAVARKPESAPAELALADKPAAKKKTADA
jgi:Xaa-Pro dipeptidase